MAPEKCNTCEEHGPLMKCLGALEQSSKDQGEWMGKIDAKLEALLTRFHDERVEQAKAGMSLRAKIGYASAATGAITLISTITNFLIKQFGG